MIPENEMGVIVYFSGICESKGWRIDSIQSAFPDAIITELKTGRRLKVEFEYMSANFIQHGHDLMKCDLIICWENNTDAFENVIDVWAIGYDCDYQVHGADEKDKQIAALKIEVNRLRNIVMQRSQDEKNVTLSNFDDNGKIRIRSRRLNATEIFNMTSAEISECYNISERSARNWRARAWQKLQENERNAKNE